MADDIELNAGTGGDTVAADEIGGVKHQRVKVQHGADGAATDVSAASPLPVDLRSDNVGGLEIVQDTAADLKCTEASAAAALALLTTIDADTDAIKTALELLDNAVDGNYLNVNANIAGTDIVGGAGAVAAGVQRVTLGDDDPAVVDLAAIEVLLGTIDADTSNMATSLGNLDDAVDGNYLNVNLNAAGTDLAMNAGAMSAQTTRVTLATDDTHFGSVGAASDIDGVVHGQLRYMADQLVTIDADTGAIKTAVELLDNAISGSEMQVDVVASLPAGTNAIGKLAANTGVDIGDVDVTSVVPGTGATNLGKARASALGATDTGVAPLAVRKDDLADLAGADGDYTPLQTDNRGAMYVNQAAAEPKQASGVAAGGAPGTDNMVAAVAGKKLLVLALGLFATSATVNNVFVDNADNDLLFNTGNPLPLSLDADADTVPGFVLPFNPGGWLKTDTVNEAITLNSSAAQDIAWTITYIETD